MRSAQREYSFSAPATLTWKKDWGEISNLSLPSMRLSAMAGLPLSNSTGGSSDPETLVECQPDFLSKEFYTK